MARLNQVIAIEKDIKSRDHGLISEHRKIIVKPALFEGLVRTYRKRDDADDDLPGEKKVVQFRVRDILASVRVSKSTLIDTLAQKDAANAQAKAAVFVDGKEIIPELPVTTLLSLEKEVTDLRTFLGDLPVLDNSEDWKFDENSGLHKTAPTETHRTKKIVEPLVLIQPTVEHPGQAQLVQKDVVAGYWAVVRQSGALPKPEKDAMVERVEKLLLAIKQAREEANSVQAPPKVGVGSALFDFLLGTK